MVLFILPTIDVGIILIVILLVAYFAFKYIRPIHIVEVDTPLVKEWFKTSHKKSNPYCLREINFLSLKQFKDYLLTTEGYVFEQADSFQDFTIYKLTSNKSSCQIWLKEVMEPMLGFISEDGGTVTRMYMVSDANNYKKFSSICRKAIDSSKLKYKYLDVSEDIIKASANRIYNTGLKWDVEKFRFPKGNSDFDEFIYTNLLEMTEKSSKSIDYHGLKKSKESIWIYGPEQSGRSRLLKSLAVAENTLVYWLDSFYCEEFMTDTRSLEFLLELKSPVTVVIDDFIFDERYIPFFKSCENHMIKFIVTSKSCYHQSQFSYWKWKVISFKDYTPSQIKNIQEAVSKTLKGYQYKKLQKGSLKEIFDSFSKITKKPESENRKPRKSVMASIKR